MKIIFFGSDDFAVSHLETLVNSINHEALACVTQPDRKKGRHLTLKSSLVKEFALSHKLPILEPASLKDSAFIRRLKDYESDMFIVIAYGRILPSEVLSLPKVFCINVHASLLPKYRGAAPINWAIINNEKTTGVSIIKLSPLLDGGDIIAQKRIDIGEDDSAVVL